MTIREIFEQATKTFELIAPIQAKLKELLKETQKSDNIRSECHKLLHQMLWYSKKFKKSSKYAVLLDHWNREIRLSDKNGLRNKGYSYSLNLNEWEVSFKPDEAIFINYIIDKYNRQKREVKKFIIPKKDFNPEMFEKWRELFQEYKEIVPSVQDSNNNLMRLTLEGKSFDFGYTIIYGGNSYSGNIVNVFNLITKMCNTFDYGSYGSEYKTSEVANFLECGEAIDVLLRNYDTVVAFSNDMARRITELRDKINKEIAPFLMLEQIKG